MNMSIDAMILPISPSAQPVYSGGNIQDTALIDKDDIRAILYLGIRGEIALEGEAHTVDILV